MKTISVIIPAARDQGMTQGLVNALHAQNRGANIDVVVTSPKFTVDGATCVHDDYEGPSRAGALAIDFAVGDYVAWLTDETTPVGNCLEVMAAFLDARPTPFIGEFKIENDAICFARRKQFARWGMMTRASIRAIGFFDPMFRSQYGDIDLSLRCWRAGGGVTTCQEAVIVHRGIEDALSLDNKQRDGGGDLAYFEKMWGTWNEVFANGVNVGDVIP